MKYYNLWTYMYMVLQYVYMSIKVYSDGCVRYPDMIRHRDPQQLPYWLNHGRIVTWIKLATLHIAAL